LAQDAPALGQDLGEVGQDLGEVGQDLGEVGQDLREGIAFPHAEVEGLTEPQLAFARLAHGIDCDAPDGQPVRLVFLLLMPPREYQLQLQLLSAMARLLTRTRAEVRRGLLAARAARGVLGMLDSARGHAAAGARGGPAVTDGTAAVPRGAEPPSRESQRKMMRNAVLQADGSLPTEQMRTHTRSPGDPVRRKNGGVPV
jgi:Phosphoenolpyruvate-dependent sugar phosphotransferase system, EIIA 2